MTNLVERCSRAGFGVKIVTEDMLKNKNQLFDLVVADVPCSGTGAWRRNPGSKWWLTQDKLERLLADQRAILLTSSKYVMEHGFIH